MTNYVKFIEELNEDELMILEKDIKDGSLQKYIDRKKEFYKIKDKVCPVCGNMVKEDCFVLIFGEPSVRKKAHFCGIDCLEYFIHNFLKNNKVKKPASKETMLKKNQKVLD